MPALPAKDKSIAAAKHTATGKEVAYRIDGNPGLVLVCQSPAVGR